jgi:flagellar biosynthesis chaperone FliJ
MEDHQKLKQILDIRKRREEKALKKYNQKRQELEEYEIELQNERTKIEQFMQKRTVELHTIQNRILTEPVNGLVFEQYLRLKDDTQKQIEQMYNAFEEKSQAFTPILDKVNEFFKEWEDIKKAQSRLKQTVDKKTAEFTFEKEQKIEKKMFDEYVHRPK